MPMARRGIGGLIVLIAGAAPMHAQPADEMVRRALAANRDYLAAAERVREAEALLRRAGIRPLPSIEAEGGSTRLLGASGSQEYSIAYVQPLETGGKRARRIEVAALGLEIARAEADERKRQLTLEVRQRYAEAAGAQRRLAVLSEAAKINSETLRLISARVEEGDAALLEKRLLETEISRAEVDRLVLEAKGEAAVFELKRIGASGDTPPAFDPQRPRDVPPFESLARLALQDRPDLRALRAAAAQARAGVELARTESVPNVTASARYAYRSSVFDQFGFDRAGIPAQVRDRENVLAFGVSVPLFSRSRNEANVEASAAREREAKLRLEQLAAAIPPEVNAALVRWNAARRALDALERTILSAAEQNLEVIRQAWQLGQLRFIDVLNEQRRVTELRLAGADAETEAVRAWAELANAVGGEIR